MCPKFFALFRASYFTFAKLEAVSLSSVKISAALDGKRRGLFFQTFICANFEKLPKEPAPQPPGT